MWDTIIIFLILNFGSELGKHSAVLTLVRCLIHFLSFVEEIKEWWLYVLLVIAAFLCLTGVGHWIALAVLVYSK